MWEYRRSCHMQNTLNYSIVCALKLEMIVFIFCLQPKVFLDSYLLGAKEISKQCITSNWIHYFLLIWHGYSYLILQGTFEQTDVATLYSVVVIEVGFAGLLCKNSIQKHDGEAVMLLGILCDTQCFFYLGWSTTNQAASSVFVKQRCLPYGVVSSVKNILYIVHSTVY